MSKPAPILAESSAATDPAPVNLRQLASTRFQAMNPEERERLQTLRDDEHQLQAEQQRRQWQARGIGLACGLLFLLLAGLALYLPPLPAGSPAHSGTPSKAAVSDADATTQPAATASQQATQQASTTAQPLPPHAVWAGSERPSATVSEVNPADMAAALLNNPAIHRVPADAGAQLQLSFLEEDISIPPIPVPAGTVVPSNDAAVALVEKTPQPPVTPTPAPAPTSKPPAIAVTAVAPVVSSQASAPALTASESIIPESADSPLIPSELANPESTKPESVTTNTADATPAPSGIKTPEADANVAAVDTLQAWAQAWANRDVEHYLSFYATDFKPSGGLSRSSWATQRRQRVRAPAWIKVELAQFKVTSLSPTRLQVDLAQTYRSPTLTNKASKRMLLVWQGGAWRIQQEAVINR